MARPGRKRKPGRREPNGRLSRPCGPDRGTEQLQARRAFLAQGGDPTKTTDPLGVMLCNKLIGEPEYSAGRRYGWLHLVLYGKSTPAAMSYGLMISSAAGDLDDDAMRFYQDREAELRECDRALGLPSMIEAVHAIAVEEHMPEWLIRSLGRPPCFRQSQKAVVGLQRLALHMGYRERVLKTA